jgi:hypothetical protein
VPVIAARRSSWVERTQFSLSSRRADITGDS